MFKVCLYGSLYFCGPVLLYEPLYRNGAISLPCGAFTGTHYVYWAPLKYTVTVQFMFRYNTNPNPNPDPNPNPNPKLSPSPNPKTK